VAKDLTEALRQLTEGGAGQTSRVDKTLPASNAAPAIPARSGSSGPKSRSGGSIASPLTETAYASRTYHSPMTITSTDGLLTWEVDPIKKVFFTDASTNAVEIEYAAPT
jgi:hypothetical protein